MVPKGTLLGAVVVLCALLVLSAVSAAYFYGLYARESSQNQSNAQELSAALQSYRSLEGSYNTSLADYGKTLGLLSTAVENLNTSTPAYRNASLALASLWDSYRVLAAKNGGALGVEFRMLVDFGNGTRLWYNDTAAPVGLNGYGLTVISMRGNVEAAWYPQFGEHLVTGLGGRDSTATTAWFVWNYVGGGWSVADTGADGIAGTNGTTIAWTLCSYDSNYRPTCSP